MAEHEGSYNGITFGPGQTYEVVHMLAYRRSTQVVTPDLPRYHGGLIGASYEAPRTLEVDMLVRADTPSGLVDALDALFAACQPLVDTERPFEWEYPGQAARQILCRCHEAQAPLLPSSWAGTPHVVVPLRFTASDPAIYSATAQTLEVEPFTSAGGFSWPARWPISWGGGGSGGGAVLVLGGDWESWARYTISGPSSGTLTNPIIEGVTQGERLAFNANGGVAITAGQTFVVESHPARRTARFATGASRYGRLSDDSEWFPLQPGSNEIRFRASGDTAGATLTVEARSAWI